MGRLALIVFLLFAAVGCRPARPAAMIQIPTLASLPSVHQLEGAERVAREFLQNWHDGDLERMFELISFASQDAHPRETFIAFYENAAAVMRLAALDIRSNAIFRESEAVAVFNYDVVFETDGLGTIEDRNRDLRLVVDDRAQDWRVAWTPADLFPELASGGRLRFDPSIPNRGNIYDRNGVVLADQEGRIVNVNVVRSRMPDYDNCLNALSAALNQPASEIQARLEARPPTELVMIGVIEEQTYVNTHELLEQYCSARFEGRRVRRYPDGTLAPHILGYVGYPDEASVDAVIAAGFTRDSIIGRSGIELSWDAELRGQPAARLVIVSPTGEVLRELGRIDARPGQSLWLTIDSDFQRQVSQIVADAFTQAKETWAPRSNGAAVVVVDIHTGELLALVSYPTFDNNAYNTFPIMGQRAGQSLVVDYQADPRNPEVNRTTQGVYTLGSVMKTLSAVAAADSGVYALDERYTCTGLWSRDIVRTDWLPGGHGTLTLAGGITNSCNPYFYEVGYRLFMADPWILPNYARLAGLGMPTGLTDIPEETGFIPDPDWFRTSFGYEMPFSEEVNVAIGQGYVQVTPLQVTLWTAAIANGGWLYTPHLVREVGLVGVGRRPAFEPEARFLDIRPDVLDVVRSGMCAVTNTPSGTAEFVFRNSPLQTIGVCGKTGTAQTGQPGTPPHAWFSAYAPRQNPEIAVVVMVETAGEGSAVAAPIARQVLEAYFGMLP
ncbi:MAG: penicillin-binding transpeptidase domain-containing protein [Aggregatilineales bacterium]